MTEEEKAARAAAAALLGRAGGLIGGKSRSHAKRASSRENGKQGGRPREALECSLCETLTTHRPESGKYKARALCRPCEARLASRGP